MALCCSMIEEYKRLFVYSVGNKNVEYVATHPSDSAQASSP